jgi:hypothetical protein
MKKNNPILSLSGLASAIALLSQTASAQTFQTVDDFRLYPDNTLNCSALAMGRDPFGNIYAAGYMGIKYPADAAAALRKSSDGGATWNIIDSYAQSVSAAYLYNAFTSDSAGVSGHSN